MVEEQQIKVELPILREAAAILRERGIFEKDLTAPEVSDIMKGVISGWLGGQEKVQASVPLMDVQITSNRQGSREGRVSATVQVEKPAKAQIRVNYVLANGRNPGTLKVASLDIEQQPEGRKAKMALKAFGIEKKARAYMENPNRALFQALSDQLKPQGIQLRGIELLFLSDQDALRIVLTGVPRTR
jgi:hypothetical protein